MRGDHWRGDGPFSARAAEALRAVVGGGRVLLTPSCTAALELAALALRLQEGDEVIVPSFTFVSTASAFALRGAKIVFADVDPATLCIDPHDVERLLGPRTRAVVCVHYAGVAADVTALRALCAGRGIHLVEDSAHGLFGSVNGLPLSSFGALAALSFHDTKNITCGEGGALIVNDESLFDLIEVLREKGTNRSRFLRGDVPRYSWVEVGSSYLLSDLLAAVLCAQLEHSVSIQRRRHALWQRYHTELQGWARDIGATMPVVPAGVAHAAHLTWLRMPDAAARSALITHLRERGVDARFHYHALHTSDVGRRLQSVPRPCPVSEAAAATLVRLPLYPDLTDAEQTRVLEAVRAYR